MTNNPDRQENHNGPILIVDDEPALRELVQYNLQQAGFDTAVAVDGAEALAAVEKLKPQLLILDLMLPKIDGLSVCRDLRRRGLRVPVLMLTALDTETDRVVGLEMGADDYLTKPFSPRELVARIRALLRRSGWKDPAPGDGRSEMGPAETAPPHLRRLDDLQIDTAARQVTAGGLSVALTPTEYALLDILSTYPGRAFNRQELLDRVWGADFFGDSRTVDVHIRNLRQKIEADPQRPERIQTVRGFGYRFATSR